MGVLTQEFAKASQLFLALAVGEKAVIADADETLREDMKEKAADELHRLEEQGALLVRVGVVLPTKGDLAVLNQEQSPVGDGDPVGVASEVLEDLLGAAEGRFSVDDPVFGAELFLPASPASASRQGLELAMEREFSLREGLLEIAEELAAKEATQGADREEEVLAAGDPSPAIQRQTATGDHSVKMRMVVQVLSPGVQDEQEADRGAEMSGVSSQGEKTLGRGTKKDPVQLALVL